MKQEWNGGGLAPEARPMERVNRKPAPCHAVGHSCKAAFIFWF